MMVRGILSPVADEERSTVVVVRAGRCVKTGGGARGGG